LKQVEVMKLMRWLIECEGENSQNVDNDSGIMNSIKSLSQKATKMSHLFHLSVIKNTFA